MLVLLDYIDNRLRLLRFKLSIFPLTIKAAFP